MKKIYNKIIPQKGFTALTIWPLLFIRKDMAWAFNTQSERHENTHRIQQIEMFVVGSLVALFLGILGCGLWSLFALPMFFYWYGIEWLIRLCYYRNKLTAYKNIAFEREAYAHQGDASYLDDRRLFAWLKYLKN